MKISEDQQDLRVRRTHKLLWNALMELLTEQAFEKITIKEICERAMVHRTTFYQHYEDKYALLEQGMREMYENFIAEVNVPPNAFSPDQPPPYYIRFFTHIAEHQRFYTLMLCTQGGEKFQRLLKDYLAEQTEVKILAFLSPTRKPTIPPALRAQFFAGAIVNTLAWWLEQGMPYSPQQMAQYLLLL